MPSNNTSIKLFRNQAEPIQAEALYNAHYAQIKAFLISRRQSEEHINEVLQELYLKLMSVDDLSQIKNPASFLIRIAHNLMIDILRREGRRDRYQVSEDFESISLESNDPSPFEEILSMQQLRLCEKALAELPPEFREILLLNRVDGMTHSQLAKKYGRSISWVEKTIVRTLEYCRRKLDRTEDF